MATYDAERGREHLMETLGNIPPSLKTMMDHAPEHFAGYLQFREAVYRTPEQGAHLDIKTKELVYVLLDVAVRNLDGAKNHARAAMKAGVTAGEIMEGCMQVMHVFGVATWGMVGAELVEFCADIERSGDVKGG